MSYSYDRRTAGHVEAAGFINGINDTYVILRWNKAIWQIEESDTPISPIQEWGKPSAPMDTYTMPTLVKDLLGREQRALIHFSPDSFVRQYPVMRGKTKGPEVREAFLKAYETYFSALIASLKEDGQDETLTKFERLLPALRRKLVWKKVAGG